MKTPNLLLLLAAGFASAALAQDATPTPSPGSPGGHRPPPPLVRALDVNRDHVISAEEIANAAAELATLDANKDGQLSAAEFCPPKPPGGPRAEKRREEGERPEKPSAQRPPPNPLARALDADKDRVISGEEMTGAPAALGTLDKNADGQLTPKEFAPRKPRRPRPNPDDASAGGESSPEGQQPPASGR